MSGEKLISILIPAYNEEIHLEALLGRALAGPLPDGYRREIVLVDDGSTDNSKNIISKYFSIFPKFRLIENKHQGKAFAINQGERAL